MSLPDSDAGTDALGYLREDGERSAAYVDCYWQAPPPPGNEPVTYPSLPEPYVNLIVPLGAERDAVIKGIASTADFMDVRSALFGVRLHLRGFLALHLAPCTALTDRLIPFESIGGRDEHDLVARLRRAAPFAERVEAFRAYLTEKLRRPLGQREALLSDALAYLLAHYEHPAVVRRCAEAFGVTPRTVARWFSSEIGISAKKLARIARFHHALGLLHAPSERSVYLDAGYYDQAHFIREFKAFTGIAPERYLGLIARLSGGKG